jgi:hypothetical protein
MLDEVEIQAPYSNVVRWLPEAEAEREQARPAREIGAMWNVIEKLMSEGATLPFPHASGIPGSRLEGLRELRPRAGRSRWRPLYIQVDRTESLILAVAPEAQIDKRGFRVSVERAVTRWEALLAG